jgi:hypothetical protein
MGNKECDMKILVIGGMHGNEPLGQEVVKLLQANPIKGIDSVLANEQAIIRDCRFVTNDLNRSFPGNPNSEDYETYRAAEILEMTIGYDVVLDFHNTHCPDNDCGFVGTTAPQQLYDVSAWLGLNRTIVADYDCLNKYAPNCLSVEISLTSAQMSAEKWYERLRELARLDAVPNSDNVQKFRFVYRMSLEDKETLGLTSENLKAFQPIDPKLAEAMNVNNPAYPIFVEDSYTPYNYGGLLNKI